MEKFTTLEGVAAPLKIINVDTDMIIPKQYSKTIKRTGLGRGRFSEQRYKDDGGENPDFILQAGLPQRQGSGGGRQFRLRLEPRTRAMGSLGFWHPLRDLDLVRRYLLQQLLQERHPADPRHPGRSRQVVRRRRTRRQCDADHRSSQSGNPRARRWHGEIRDRPVPQALPDERPRRYRPHHGEKGFDRRLRGKSENRARLGLISIKSFFENAPEGDACGPTSSPSGTARSMRSG